MRAAAKKCALSASVSLALSGVISVLPPARRSSKEKLTPAVFALDAERARKGLGGRTVSGRHWLLLDRLVAPATMEKRFDQNDNSSSLYKYLKLLQTIEGFFRTFAITMRPCLVIYCIVLGLP
jgi:hypothetical protein